MKMPQSEIPICYYLIGLSYLNIHVSFGNRYTTVTVSLEHTHFSIKLAICNFD